MSQIKNNAYLLLIAYVALFSIITTGCSDSNKNALFYADSGKHPENWYTEHRAAYKNDPNVCHECHGTDLLGGTSSISCYSGSFDGQSCHAGGPSGHPADWLPAGHKAAAVTDIIVCQQCHGSDYAGGTTGVSCTSCHLGGTSSVHPTSWSGNAGANHRDHVLLQGNATACSNLYCHGVNYGGVTGSGLSCTGCHSETYYNCTSCHGQPPATGRHVSHISGHGAGNAICTDCHALASSTHDNGTKDIANSITYSFATKSCTSGCHGARTW